ncbi:hypothetical protein PAPYR_11433 [Paratrimastix pyriformis]|uniref:Uncharacterized protein n=1 Tax=Paratrimastix pyriformis TaxID=342808 RepID=A0ABQ8U9D8_9EUKA|nr:hypothetical protein PAPYR_11433 [Paratrimastix pyriformis]
MEVCGHPDPARGVPFCTSRQFAGHIAHVMPTLRRSLPGSSDTALLLLRNPRTSFQESPFSESTAVRVPCRLFIPALHTSHRGPPKSDDPFPAPVSAIATQLCSQLYAQHQEDRNGKKEM